MTNEISKNKHHYWEMKTPTLGIYYLKFCICYVNELVQELLDNTSIFYYDAQLGATFITFEPLLE